MLSKLVSKRTPQLLLEDVLEVLPEVYVPKITLQCLRSFAWLTLDIGFRFQPYKRNLSSTPMNHDQSHVDQG